MYVIRSQRLAGWLMIKGFVLMGMEKAKDGSGRNVFLFNQSDDLLKSITKYKYNHIE